jgi:HlyD family secretion protein
MEVNVDVNENDINRLHLGDTALIEVDAFIDKKFKGVVTEIANSATVVGTTADQVTNFAVKVRILTPSYQNENTTKTIPFKPGLSATVDIQTQRAKGIIIPIQSVTTREDDKADYQSDKPQAKTKQNDKNNTKTKVKEYVFVLEGNKVKQVEVKTGIQNDENIIIISGLKNGQKVISAPYSAISKTLKDGTLVEVVKKDKLFGKENKDE